MDKKDCFSIPVVLFLFKRVDTLPYIFKRLSIIRPQKLYILSDEGRDEKEKKMVKEVRKQLESFITWPCEVIRNYAKENRGVYENIGKGAVWVLEREKKAIFLEDDNLPEISFFKYCKELLEKYEDNQKIMWICGTNYLGTSDLDGKSYMFTQNLLPCGWASWADKFLKYYDGELLHMEEENIYKIMKSKYKNKALFRQQFSSISLEYYRKKRGEKYRSWDYQMIFSLKYYDLYGIMPKNNQIKNIGVDDLSEHGGCSFNNIMTKRFCGMDSYEIEFPLIHPEKQEILRKYEKKIEKIILYPLSRRIRNNVTLIIKKILKIPSYIPLSEIKKVKKGNKK